MTPSAIDELARVASIEELYNRLGPLHMMPGWNKPKPSLWPEPRKTYQPRHWSFATARAALDAAGRYVGTDLAERRNLMLYNPVEGNTYAATRTMAAAYQMIRPGERARSHRHSPNALRLVIEAGPDTYTLVNGEALPLRPKDVLLTPGWCWHGHFSDSDRDSYWIDVLDVPLVHLLEPMFYEPHPDDFEPETARPTESPYFFPWARISGRLMRAPDDGGRFSRRLPLEGAREQLTTMDLEVVAVEPGLRGTRFRTTANIIYAAMEGSGRLEVDGEHFAWQAGDVLVVPAWRPQRHVAADGGVLLKVSDEPAMRALGFLREESLGASA